MSRVCRRASPEANTVGPLLCTLGSLIFLQRSALLLNLIACCTVTRRCLRATVDSVG